MELSCVEKDLKNSLAEKYNDGRLLTIGKVAHITGAQNKCWKNSMSI